MDDANAQIAAIVVLRGRAFGVHVVYLVAYKEEWVGVWLSSKFLEAMFIHVRSGVRSTNSEGHSSGCTQHCPTLLMLSE
jgi:hypothetical protein